MPKFDVLISQPILVGWGLIRVQIKETRRGLWSVVRGGILGRAARSEIIEDGVGTSHCALRLVTTETSLPNSSLLPLAIFYFERLPKGEKLVGRDASQCGPVWPMCENLSCGRSAARLAAAGKEGVEIRLQDRGTEGFEHSCDQTGRTLSP